MRHDAIDYLHEINPVPTDPSAPPIGELLARLDYDIRSPEDVLASRPRVRRRLGRTRAPLVRIGVPAVTAAVLLVVALAVLGSPARRGFDVAAEVYRATTPGRGVVHTVIEYDGGVVGHALHHNLEERWSALNPLRTRDVYTEGSLVLESTLREIPDKQGQSAPRDDPGKMHAFEGSIWSNRTPKVIDQVKVTDPAMESGVARIRQAYRAGDLRLEEKATIDGRAVYRLAVARPPTPGLTTATVPRDTVTVDASTFYPIEIVTHVWDRQGNEAGRFVAHFVTYEELPATPDTTRLLNLASHPAATIIRH
jgi:hypothetical protein